jgi:Outer membrane protein beta-barrel domain
MSLKLLFPSLFVLPLITVTAASPAFAQKGAQITPLFGIRTGGAFRIEDTTRALNFDSAPTFGLAFNYGLTNYLELELMWSRQKTTVKLGDSPSVSGTDDSVGVPSGTPLFDVTTNYFHGGILYGGGGPRFHPYVAAGLGVNHLVPDADVSSSLTKLSVSVGLGFKTYINERFGFRFDARALGTRGGAQQEAVSCGVFGCASFKKAATFWQANYVAGVIIAF